jgi:hypothetical protein
MMDISSILYDITWFLAGKAVANHLALLITPVDLFFLHMSGFSGRREKNPSLLSGKNPLISIPCLFKLALKGGSRGGGRGCRSSESKESISASSDAQNQFGARYSGVTLSF